MCWDASVRHVVGLDTPSTSCPPGTRSTAFRSSRTKVRADVHPAPWRQVDGPHPPPAPVFAKLPPPRMRSASENLCVVPPHRAHLLGHRRPLGALVLDSTRPHALQLRRLPAGPCHFGPVVPPLLPQLVMTRASEHPRQPQLLTSAELQQPHPGCGLRCRLASLCFQLLTHGPRGRHRHKASATDHHQRQQHPGPSHGMSSLPDSARPPPRQNLPHDHLRDDTRTSRKSLAEVLDGRRARGRPPALSAVAEASTKVRASAAEGGARCARS